MSCMHQYIHVLVHSDPTNMTLIDTGGELLLVLIKH
jgi:hypothetical protein